MRIWNKIRFDRHTQKLSIVIMSKKRDWVGKIFKSVETEEKRETWTLYEFLRGIGVTKADLDEAREWLDD